MGGVRFGMNNIISYISANRKYIFYVDSRDVQIGGQGERQARRVVAALVEHGVLVAESTRAPGDWPFPGH